MLGVSGQYIHEVIKDGRSAEGPCQLMLEKQGAMSSDGEKISESTNLVKVPSWGKMGMQLGSSGSRNEDNSRLLSRGRIERN